MRKEAQGKRRFVFATVRKSVTKVKGAHCSGPINITPVDKNTSDTTLLVTVLGAFLYISLRMAGLEIERVEGLSSVPKALGPQEHSMVTHTHQPLHLGGRGRKS